MCMCSSQMLTENMCVSKQYNIVFYKVLNNATAEIDTSTQHMDWVKAFVRTVTHEYPYEYDIYKRACSSNRKYIAISQMVHLLPILPHKVIFNQRQCRKI